MEFHTATYARTANKVRVRIGSKILPHHVAGECPYLDKELVGGLQHAFVLCVSFVHFLVLNTGLKSMVDSWQKQYMPK